MSWTVEPTHLPYMQTSVSLEKRYTLKNSFCPPLSHSEDGRGTLMWKSQLSKAEHLRITCGVSGRSLVHTFIKWCFGETWKKTSSWTELGHRNYRRLTFTTGQELKLCSTGLWATSLHWGENIYIFFTPFRIIVSALIVIICSDCLNSSSSTVNKIININFQYKLKPREWSHWPCWSVIYLKHKQLKDVSYRRTHEEMWEHSQKMLAEL